MTTYAERPWTNTYDEGVSKTLEPFPEMGLHECLQQSARRNPQNTALVTSLVVPLFGRINKEVTYDELNKASDAMAAGLVDMGLKKGDRVAVVMPNCVAFAITYFAILKAGGVVAATNPTYPEGKMQGQLNDCDAEFLVTLTLFYDVIKKIQSGTKIKKVIVANIKEYFPTIGKVLFSLAREKKDGHYVQYLQFGDEWFQDILTKYASQRPNVDISPDDLALFQYTGGTTGVAKAAMATHRGLVCNMLMMDSFLGVDGVAGEDEIYLGAIPMFHVYGLVAMLSNAIYKGAKITLIPNPREIDDVLGQINDLKPTLFPGVPALYNAINNHPRVQSGEISLKSIRVCVSGSAPLAAATKEEFERLSGASLREGFGMSEAPTAISFNPIRGENRVGSIGLPLPDVDMLIVDLETDEEVPVGEVGELLVSAPNVMIGYHNMPEETEKVFSERNGKRWLHTGDIAKMDEDGYFYIVDRKKDMALIGGYNVYPASVEKALKEHDCVLEVGVAAVPHPQKEGQEALKAWIVCKPNQSVSEDELQKHCEKYLAQYEIPRRFEFIDELPKTAVGKTLRRELVRMEIEKREKATS